jgi:hypothetical protein
MAQTPPATIKVRRGRSHRLVVGGLLALLLMLATALIGASPASAAITTWTGSLPVAKGSTTGTITWDNRAFTEKLTVKTGTLAAGKCATVFFDWVTHTHNDARAIRDCKSNDTLTYSFTEADSSQLTGKVRKFGLCYGVKDQRGTCTGQRSITNDWTPWPDTTRTAPCDLSWVLRNANGALTTFIDPHSTSATLRPGGTC